MKAFILKHVRLFSVAAVTVSVLVFILVANLVGDVPKPLVILLGGTFLVWTAVYWLLNRTSSPSARQQATHWVLSWVVGMMILLGVVYQIDRAGWIWTSITGYDTVIAEHNEEGITLSLNEFVEQNPSFLLADGTLTLPKGEHIFKKSVIIPQGTRLIIEPGTTLRFGAGRSLISYSPIYARGTQAAPIRFEAQNSWLKWGTVGVVRTEKSTFEQVFFGNGRRAQVNDIAFVAGLSLIESDVEIIDSEFVSMFGKDAVNLVKANVLVQGNQFRVAAKDCLDLDGGTGEVSHNLFIDCDDEGIDLSANQELQVFDNTILDVRGGRMGVDENPEAVKALNTFGFSQ